MFLTTTCCLALFSIFNFNFFFSNPNNFPKKVAPASKYTLVLAGDSMTQALGAGETILPILRSKHPNKEIHILNYGIGSTSILTLPNRLTKGAIRGNETLPPILNQNFDVILIESFGNNPLSEYSLSDGLKKQEESLDQVIKLIREAKPKAVIIFVATIAPNRERYAENIVNLTTELREKWADERISYIKNHIKYAKDHKIPLIDLFDKSLDKAQDYINDSDFIHPSNNGLVFIGEGIANYLVKKRVLPF